jgi:hypothetical protein
MRKVGTKDETDESGPSNSLKFCICIGGETVWKNRIPEETEKECMKEAILPE